MGARKMMITIIIFSSLLALTTSVHSQITWYSNGLGLSDKTPGKVSTDTLRFILGINSERRWIMIQVHQLLWIHWLLM